LSNIESISFNFALILSILKVFIGLD